MKMPIKWHQRNLKNMKETQERVFAEIRKLEIVAANNAKYIMHYAMQIDSAIKEGKDGFDAEKYKKVKI